MDSWKYVRLDNGRVVRSWSAQLGNKAQAYVPPHIWKKDNGEVVRYLNKVSDIETLLRQMTSERER